LVTAKRQHSRRHHFRNENWSNRASMLAERRRGNIATYPLVLLLKGAITSGVGNGTRDIASCVISPAVFLFLGFKFGRWPGLILSGVCIAGTRWIANPLIAQFVEDLGNRGASYAWPMYLPGMYAAGCAVSMILIWRKLRIVPATTNGKAST